MILIIDRTKKTEKHYITGERKEIKQNMKQQNNEKKKIRREKHHQ